MGSQSESKKTVPSNRVGLDMKVSEITEIIPETG